MSTVPITSLESYRALTPKKLSGDYVFWKIFNLNNLLYLNPEAQECIEKWKPIKGYEELYAISNIGRVKCLNKRLLGNGGYHIQKEKIKVQRLSPNGYLTVLLWKQQKAKHFMVHVLVATHFIDNPENKKTVNHKEGVKVDNRFFMLEWNTISENRQHAYDIGLQKPTSGVLHGMAKLNNQQVIEIYKSPGTLAELAKKYNVCFQNISNIKRRKTWTHLTKNL